MFVPAVMNVVSWIVVLGRLRRLANDAQSSGVTAWADPAASRSGNTEERVPLMIAITDPTMSALHVGT